MDIDTALKRMRELIAKVAIRAYVEDADPVDADALSMAVVFEAIDGWLSQGGFKPTDWA